MGSDETETGVEEIEPDRDAAFVTRHALQASLHK